MDCSPLGSCPWDFSRQEYWSGLPSPSQENCPAPGIKPMSPASASGFFTTEPPGKPIMKYYSAIKRNEILIHATTWMSPENMLTERSQTQKVTYYVVPLYEISRRGKSIDTESRLVAAKGQKRRQWRLNA